MNNRNRPTQTAARPERTPAQDPDRNRPALPSRGEARAWLLMRLSALLLIPLVWIHVLLQDILVGVHGINLDYIALRWASLGWRLYDGALLALAFAHGMNGLRQVLEDYVHQPRTRRILRIALLVFWLTVTAMGMAALLGGVRS